MHKQNSLARRVLALAFWLSLTNGSIAQTNADHDPGAPREMDLRYEDHRRVTAPVGGSISRYRKFTAEVLEPAMEEQVKSLRPATKLDIPHSLRSQWVGELKHMHGVVQLALDQSERYSRFKRDATECQLWVETIQYYVDGLHALTEEMGRSDLSAGVFASMLMNQVTTTYFGIGSLQQAVLPCFFEEGQYMQAVMPAVRKKADELRGLKLAPRPASLWWTAPS